MEDDKNKNSEQEASGQEEKVEAKTDEGAKKSLTEADFQKWYDEKLERDGWKERKKKAELYDKQVKEGMSEAEKVQAKVTEAEQRAQAAEDRATQLELNSLKKDILSEAGLPITLLKRVVGTDEKTIRSDVEELKTLFKEGEGGDIGSGTNPDKKGKDLEGKTKHRVSIMDALRGS